MMDQLTGYPGVFLLCLLAGIALPFPEDIAIAIVGVQIKSGAVAWGPALVLAAFGVLCRDVFVWSIGRFFGDWVLQRPWLARLIGSKHIEKARKLVVERGAYSVLAGRALVGMRMPVFFVAGTMGIPLVDFIKWDSLGLMITTPILVGLGVYLGAPLVDGLKMALVQVGWLPWALAVFITILLFGFAHSRGRKIDSNEESSEAELSDSSP